MLADARRAVFRARCAPLGVLAILNATLGASTPTPVVIFVGAVAAAPASRTGPDLRPVPFILRAGAIPVLGFVGGRGVEARPPGWQDERGQIAPIPAAVPALRAQVAVPAGVKIVAPRSGGVYLGAYNHGGSGLADFEKAIGKKVAVVGMGIATGCRDGGTEGTLPRIDIPCRESLWQRGYVSSYGIEALRGGRFSNEDVRAGKIDQALRQVAAEIARWGRPIFWFYQREPGHQFVIDSSTAARGDRGRPSLYVDVHRHIHSVVEDEIRRTGKPSNITWVMGGIIEAFRPGFYAAYYPGDAYVDWHAFDWYASPLVYRSITTLPGWGEAMQFAPNKPVLLMEFGVVHRPEGASGRVERSEWFRAFFHDVRTNPALKNLAAFLYWQDGRHSALVPTDTEARVWKEEIAGHPGFWHSQVETISVVP